MDRIESLDAYQQAAKRTAPRVREAYGIPMAIDVAARNALGKELADLMWEPFLRRYDQLVWSCGLTGEAGEFADIMKKVHGHGHELDEETKLKALKELGDVLWYLAVLADSLGFTLSQVANTNIEKLKERFKDGFTIEESKRRDQ